MTPVKMKLSSKFLEFIHHLSAHRIYNIDGKIIYLTTDVFSPKFTVTPKFVADNLKLRSEWSILDMGTGSGYIAIRAAEKVRKVTAVDNNPSAVRCAKINVTLNRLNQKIAVYRSDLFSNLKNKVFDSIIFNPPYFPGEPKNPLQEAWLNTSPQKLIMKFTEQARNHLFNSGYIQLGYSSLGPLEKAKKIIEDKGFKLIKEVSKKTIWETISLMIFRVKNT